MDVSDLAHPHLSRLYTSGGRPAGAWGRGGVVKGPKGIIIQTADGLYDPAQYFHRLQCGRDCQAENRECEAKSVFVAIEKILTGDEQLPESWAALVNPITWSGPASTTRPPSGFAGCTTTVIVALLFNSPSAALKARR